MFSVSSVHKSQLHCIICSLSSEPTVFMTKNGDKSCKLIPAGPFVQKFQTGNIQNKYDNNITNVYKIEHRKSILFYLDKLRLRTYDPHVADVIFKFMYFCLQIVLFWCEFPSDLDKNNPSLVQAWTWCQTGNTIQWRYNEHNGVSNHQPHDCLLNHLFRRRSMKTSKLRVTGLCEGKSLVTSEFPAQRASNAENVSIWWCHHEAIIWTNDGLAYWCFDVSSHK